MNYVPVDHAGPARPGDGGRLLRRRGKPSLMILRIAELRRLFVQRYGPDGLPDDDAGRGDLRVLLEHQARLPADAAWRLTSTIERWAPWMSRDSARVLVDEVVTTPRKWTAQALGEELGLRSTERQAL